MKDTFEPSPDFVEKVMVRVYRLEAGRISIFNSIYVSKPVRYVLAGGGTVFGILTAAPVF